MFPILSTLYFLFFAVRWIFWNEIRELGRFLVNFRTVFLEQLQKAAAERDREEQDHIDEM